MMFCSKSFRRARTDDRKTVLFGANPKNKRIKQYKDKTLRIFNYNLSDKSMSGTKERERRKYFNKMKNNNDNMA